MNVKLLIARKQAGLTQGQLAERAGVQQWDISRVESAGWIPPPDIRHRMAEALHVASSDLFPMVQDEQVPA